MSKLEVAQTTAYRSYANSEFLARQAIAGRGQLVQHGLHRGGMAVFVAVVLALGLLGLVWASGRAREICVLSVRAGRLLVMRGALPASLLEGLRDVVERQATARGTIRVLRDGDRARLEASGLDAYAAQRARNVLGTYPLARLLAAPPPRTRNLGQRLGLSWLAFRLHDAGQNAAKQRAGH